MTYDIKCKHCGRFLATVEKSVQIVLKCSNSKCKKLETYRIEFMTDMTTRNTGHQFISKPSKEQT